jgi:hypothetical protein
MASTSTHALHKFLWMDEECFMREGVLSAHNRHLWAWDNPHVIRERVH